MRRGDVRLEIGKRVIEPCDLAGQNLRGRLGGVRQRRILLGARGTLIDTANALGGDQAELRDMASQMAAASTASFLPRLT